MVMKDTLIVPETMYNQWLKGFLTRNNLIAIDGPSSRQDMFGVTYTALDLLGEKVEGERSAIKLAFDSPDVIPWMLDRAGESLLRWLDGRDKIVWRERPQFSVDIMTIPVPGISRDSSEDLPLWYFYTRLTAYE